MSFSRFGITTDINSLQALSLPVVKALSCQNEQKTLTKAMKMHI